jgi:hypothetical protein
MGIMSAPPLASEMPFADRDLGKKLQLSAIDDADPLRRRMLPTGAIAVLRAYF